MSYTFNFGVLKMAYQTIRSDGTLLLSSYLVGLNRNDAVSASAWVMVERHTHGRARGRYPFLFRLWINLEDMGVNGKYCSLPVNNRYIHKVYTLNNIILGA